MGVAQGVQADAFGKFSFRNSSDTDAETDSILRGVRFGVANYKVEVGRQKSAQNQNSGQAPERESL